MKIWLTPPNADYGIQEVDTVCDPKHDEITYELRGMTHTSWSFREGISWHRTKADAVRVAREHRIKRIRYHLNEAERIASLAPIV